MSSAANFWDPINKKLEQRHADQMDLQKQQRASYQGIIQDPNTSDDMKNWAWGEYQKSLHPSVQKRIGAVQPFIQKMFGEAPPNQGPSSPPPGPVFDTGAANKRALDLAQQKSDIEEKRQVAVQHAKPAAGQMRNLQYKLPDNSIVNVQQNSRTGQYFTQKGDPFELPEGAEPYKTPTPGTRKEYHYSVPGPDGKPKDTTVFQDTKSQAMYDIHGKPYTLPDNAEPVDEEAKVAKIRGSYYGTGQMNTMQRAFKAKYGVDDDQAEQMAADWAVEGARRTLETKGAGKTTERPMVVGGEVQAVPFQSAPQLRATPDPTIPPPKVAPSSAPVPAPSAAPAIPAAANGAGAPPLPSPDSGAGPSGGVSGPNQSAAAGIPMPAPVPAPAPAAAAPAGGVPNSSPASVPPAAPAAAAVPQAVARPPVPQAAVPPRQPQQNTLPPNRNVGIPPAQYRAAQQDIRAISAASVPVFGDPTQPDVKSLQDYSDLARDPQSVRRIANATKLLTLLKDSDLPDAHASVEGGGISLGLGPLAQLIQNSTGVTKAAAEAQAQQSLNALKSMTSREREYYNALLSSREGIVGLRRATSGNGTRYAVDAMANTLPIIGQNVVDEAGYKDLLNRQAGIFVDASRGQPKSAMTPEQATVFDRLSTLSSNRAAGPKAAPALPVVKSKADFDKLPKGTIYIEDGNKFKKP